MAIRYSQKAFRAISYLFRPYNDIEIYVEDDLNRNMYEILIERILDGNAKVKRIFSLGGRNKVITACENDQDDTRQRLYLIDGDIDLLIGEEKPDLRYLYRLGVYDSENLLLSEKAAVEVAFEDMPSETKANIKSLIDIETLIEDAKEKLKPLFIIYGVKHLFEKKDKKQIHIETCKYKVERLCKDGRQPINVSKTKVSKRVKNIKNELMKDYGYKKKEIDAAILEVENNVDNEISRYISGKTYLLPIIFYSLRNKAKTSSSKEQLKPRLARYCELDIDPNFSKAIFDISQGYDLLN